MKYLIRVFLFNVFALWITSEIFPGLQISGTWTTMVGAGLVLSLLMLIVAPFLRILFIPINLITFGVVSWFVNVIVLYILTLVAPSVAIHAWTFPGFSWEGFAVPSFAFSYFAALIVSSLTITVFSNLLHSVSEG